MVKAKFTTGERGGVKLVVYGYRFTKALTSQSFSRWVCHRKNRDKCRARVILNSLTNIVTILNPEHNH